MAIRTSWSPYNTRVVGSSGPFLCLWNCQSHPCGWSFKWRVLASLNCSKQPMFVMCVRGESPTLPAQERSCLGVGAKHIKCSQSSQEPWGTEAADIAPAEDTKTFFWFWLISSLMPCLLNKLTSFPNLPLLWSKDCLLKGQKLSCFSACVTWTWGEFKWLIMWLFQSFFTYHFFLFYFDLKGSALTFQSH